MRIAISADDAGGIDAVVSPHFGRCPYFTVVEVEGTETRSIEVVQNPFYGGHQPGQVPAFVQSLGADVMLTGGMGGRAIQFFGQFGIEPVTGASGTVQRSVELYLGGQLQGVEACKESMSHGHGDLPAPGEFEKDEMGRLREEVEALQQQLAEAERRLTGLGGGE
jgi:predicted Fe-Mo cluster-binding NifX family protein